MWTAEDNGRRLGPVMGNVLISMSFFQLLKLTVSTLVITHSSFVLSCRSPEKHAGPALRVQAILTFHTIVKLVHFELDNVIGV